MDDNPAIGTLLEKISNEQKKIDSHEGNVVVSLFGIGRHLAKLRPLARKTWKLQLDAIGMSPRVANRYVKLGESEIGLNESDLLKRLPSDLMKLEWLCRLSVVQLSGLLDSLDCKKATRSEVIAAVREVLGESKPVKTPDIEKEIKGLINRLIDTVESLEESEPEVQNRVRKSLKANLNLLEKKISEGESVAINTLSQVSC